MDLFNKITLDKQKAYVTIIILYVLAFIYSIVIAPKLAGADEGTLASSINTVHETCVAGCRANICKLSIRGDSYYIGATDDNKRSKLSKCATTFWGMTHYALYFAIGFLFPGCFWETFAVGIGFEAFEAMAFGCHDTFDIFLNSAGFFTGSMLNKTFDICE
jgi:hypothetical protein